MEKLIDTNQLKNSNYHINWWQVSTFALLTLLIFFHLPIPQKTKLGWELIQTPDKFLEENFLPQTPTQVLGTQIQEASPTPDLYTNWLTYENHEAGFSFQYPPEFLEFGILTEKIITGEKGNQICITFIDGEDENPNEYINENFTVSLLSQDYQADRAATFLDSLGYQEIDSEFFYKLPANKNYKIPEELVTKFTNKNDIEMIKITGANTPDGYPTTSTPGEGYVGVLINTQNAIYPAIILEGNKSLVTINLFTQIIDSINLSH